MKAVTVKDSIRTWPLATAAAAAPKKKGVIVLAVLNTRPQILREVVASSAWPRNIKAAPRITMPITARVKGTKSAIESTEKANGKAVKSPTIKKISQT